MSVENTLVEEAGDKIVKMEPVGIGEILDKPWDAVFGHFEALFNPIPSIFWAVVFSTIVIVSFIKSEDPTPPTILMIVLGALFDGLIAGPTDIYFKIAVGGGIGVMAFLIYRGRQ